MFWFLVCSPPMPWEGGVTQTFCCPDARVRKLGGSSGPEELQEAPWGPGAAREPALLGEPLPACSSPATLGPSGRRRRGGRWRAGRDRRSSPSTPEPVGGGEGGGDHKTRLGLAIPSAPSVMTEAAPSHW